MITEHATWDIVPGRGDEFEATIQRAVTLLAQIPGFVSVEILRSLDRQNRYLLIVLWQRLEDHTEGFRNSPQYLEWRSLLEGLYERVTVEHFRGEFDPHEPGSSARA